MKKIDFNNLQARLYNKSDLKKKRSVLIWQDEASKAVEYFKDGKSKTGSIFKSFRDNNKMAKIALSDCKELNKPFALYFLKVYNELVKRSRNSEEA